MLTKPLKITTGDARLPSWTYEGYHQHNKDPTVEPSQPTFPTLASELCPPPLASSKVLSLQKCYI